MDELKLGVVESRFADIIWSHEPLHSRDLVKLCEQELNWKKPTTYTVLRKLCERGIFQNENSTVTSQISREEFYSLQSHRFVEEGAWDMVLDLTRDWFTFQQVLLCDWE